MHVALRGTDTDMTRSTGAVACSGLANVSFKTKNLPKLPHNSRKEPFFQDRLIEETSIAPHNIDSSASLRLIPVPQAGL